MTYVSELGTESESVLHCLPDGVALVGNDLTIHWANGCLRRWFPATDFTGLSFYTALGNPESLGADTCALQSSLNTGTAQSATLQTADGKYYQVHASPPEPAETL